MDAPVRSSASPPRPLVGSVVQAVAVLRHLGRTQRPEGVSAIAARLGISPSSCFNILKTLACEELASFDPNTRTYVLGPGAVELARQALGRDEAARVARAAMARIAATHDVAVGLWRLGADDRLTLTALAESEASTRIHLVLGQRQPSGVGAAGRAVMAARGPSDAELRAACRGGRWRQPPAPSAYVAQVRAAQAAGFALDIDQLFHGVTTAAAAVVDAEGQVRFCLSASGFSGQADAARLQQIGAALRDAAAGIAREIYGVAIARPRGQAIEDVREA